MLSGRVHAIGNNVQHDSSTCLAQLSCLAQLVPARSPASFRLPLSEGRAVGAMRGLALLLWLAALLASETAASEGHGARHHRLAQRARQARNATAATPTAAPKRAAACAASYKPSTSVTTIKGTGTLPKATARVTRCVGPRNTCRADRRSSGTQLKLGSKTFKVVGPNIVRASWAWVR